MSENDLAKTQAITKRKLIDIEIKSHSRSWCKANCINFDPALYRHRRNSGYSAKELQSDPELCHQPASKGVV